MDRTDFEHVFKDNYRQMYRLAMSILADEEESHDVVHDVFERLLESDVVVKTDSLTSLLLTSVRNRCLNVLKHKSVRERFTRLCSTDVETETADIDIYEHRLEELNEFIDAHFTDRMKQVFSMKYFDGMKYREIAEALGISEVAVYKHLARCLEDVRTNFKNSEQ